MYSETEAKLVTENRELRAEVERLRGVSSMPPDYVKNVIRASRGDRKKMREATARAEAAEAIVAVLRGALETLNHAAKVAISTEYGGCFDEETPLVIRLLDGTCDETDATLALTPASAGEKEAANG